MIEQLQPNVLDIRALCLICLLTLTGCKDSAVIWSGQALSPDTHYVANAQTEQYGGPGTAGVFTTAYLKQAHGKPVEILSLSNETAYPLGITSLNVAWITPTQLQITYKGNAEIDFLAVRCAGVDISLLHQ